VGKGDSTIGLIATTYNFIEKHNDLGGIDGRFRIDKQTIFNFQVLGTTSRNFFFDPFTGTSNYGTGNGFAYTTTYDVSGRNFGWQLYGEGYTKRYRADVGFFGRTNTNFNSAFVRYNTNPNPKKTIISRHVHNFSWIGYDFQGRIQNWESENYIEWRLPRNSYFSLAWEPAYERILEEEFGVSRNAPCINDIDPNKRCRAAFYGPDDERSVQKTISLLPAARNTARKSSSTARGLEAESPRPDFARPALRASVRRRRASSQSPWPTRSNRLRSGPPPSILGGLLLSLAAALLIN
jgi:hypothetical protein